MYLERSHPAGLCKGIAMINTALSLLYLVVLFGFIACGIVVTSHSADKARSAHH
jgi:hypothetical protein